MTSKHPIDASIILNVHREAIFLRRTLLSLDEAVQFAKSKGFALELVIVLDRTNDETLEVISSFDFKNYSNVQYINVDNGSLGLSRNDGIKHAQGEYIFTSDADDLISDNYIYETLSYATKVGPDALYFPEYLLGFGDQYYITRYQGLDDITPMAFIDGHPYISRVCAHREVFQKLQYEDLRLSQGYAYEDWHFNAEAVALGLDIHTVPDTILFYRQRPGSLLRTANSISIRQISPTALFEPKTFIEISTPYFEELSKLSDPGARRAPVSRDFLYADNIYDMVKRANAIEPSISAKKYDNCYVYSNCLMPPPAGLAYYTLCKIIQDKKFSDVFLFPFMSRGGAEKYFLALLEALYSLDPRAEALVLLGEELNEPKWTDRLPPNAVVIDLNLLCRSLPMATRCLLALKIIETCSPDTRIHMRQSAFADMFLGSFGPVLKQWKSIYYRFADTERVENGYPIIQHSPLGLISENLNYLSKVICDSTTTIRKDHYRIGTQNHKWHHLYAPIEAPAVLPQREADADHRILWASRLDTEKRPSLLPLIAEGLRSAVPRARIEVFGGAVFKGLDRAKFEGIPNLQYHGPYDGFNSLPLSRYSIFMYTSLCDGIPNTLLEAMSCGLAIIAPDVGSISEVIIDGETGILLPSIVNDEDMALSYVEAARTLITNPNLTRRLAETGQAHVLRAHSPEVHSKRVADIFGVQQRSYYHG